MNMAIEKKLTSLIDEVIRCYRAKGFPSAHKDRTGVVKVIETPEYHLEFDFACQKIKGVGNGVGLCLYIPERSMRDYRSYFDQEILDDELQAIVVLEYGKKETNRTHGVVVKCWLKEVDWTQCGFKDFKERLDIVFEKFRRAMPELPEIVRSRFLVWAVKEQTAAKRPIRGCGDGGTLWTKVLADLNDRLARRLGSSVGHLATVCDLDLLELDRFLADNDHYKRTAQGAPGVCAVEERGTGPSDVKQCIVEQAYADVFNAYLESKDSHGDKLPPEGNCTLSALRATDYIARTLERSQHGKKFENYVVAGLWNRILAEYKYDLKRCPRPVTQQHVTRDGEHEHAYIDLYFPELKLAVECDEAHHKGNIVADRLREVDIVKSGLVDSENDILRVDATKPLSEIDGRLNEIAKMVFDRVKTRKVAGVVSAAEVVRENGQMVVSDGLVYWTKAEALEALGIRRWKNGPLCSEPFEDGFYDTRQDCWRILFLDLDRKCKPQGWQWLGESSDVRATKKTLGDCGEADKVIVFVGEPEGLGYAFAGIYRWNGEDLIRKAEQVKLFTDVFGN